MHFEVTGMATTKALPAITGSEQSQAQGTRGSRDGAALVPVSAGSGVEVRPGLVLGPAAHIPVELDVAIPVRAFRVRNLLVLEPGQVIETGWENGEDLPLASGQVQLAWSEFEVQENNLAVRITRLA